MRLGFTAWSILIFYTVSISYRSDAAVITSQGAVKALTHVNQIGITSGVAGFDEASSSTVVSPNAYASQGMILHGTTSGIGTELEEILPNIVSSGRVILPVRRSPDTSFPAPIGGGGAQEGQIASLSFGATFTEPVTQFGATISLFAPRFQYIVAWAADGSLIGQVAATSSTGPPEATFLGIDTGSTPIAFVLIGNDDVFAGERADPAGLTMFVDNVRWGIVPEPDSLLLAVFATLGMLRRQKVCVATHSKCIQETSVG